MGRVELPRVSPLDPKSYLTVVFPAFLGTFEPENTNQDHGGQGDGKVARQVDGTGDLFITGLWAPFQEVVKGGVTHETVYDSDRGRRSSGQIRRDRQELGSQWKNSSRQDRALLGICY